MIYAFEKFSMIPLCRLWVRKVDGIENIPEGAFVVVANHTSYYETLLVPSLVIPRIKVPMHALVNEIYWSSFIASLFLNHWQCIKVSMEKNEISKKKNVFAFQEALKYLKKGEIMMVFPEGHRSRDGKLQKGKTGAARLALKAKVPVLPIGIMGAGEVLPRGKIFPRFKRCEVQIGKPIYFDNYYKKKLNKKILEESTREIMQEIAKLASQKYNY